MPAALYQERIAGAGATPARWLLWTHGIFGSGSNWRAIARRLTTRRPDWGVVLVDLRQHGRSEPGTPPHTLAAAADDLRALVVAAGDIHALAGHSFGGKVVLAARARVQVAQTWVLDASPDAQPDAMQDHQGPVVRVLELLERLPKLWPRREDLVAAITREGYPVPFARWLAMNLVAAGDAFALRLDTAAVRALLADYYATDLWQTALDPGPGPLEVVVAARASTLSTAARARLAAAPPHLHVHTLDVDHWLHIEAPDAVVELFATRLP